MKSVTKEDLAKAVAEKNGITNLVAKAIVYSTVEAIKQSLEQGYNVQLRGFGTFKIVTRKEKPARVIKTGERVIIPEHKDVKFKKLFMLCS